MREIKFRAWDKVRNEMIYNSNQSCFDPTVNVGWELMQYTGLKDRHGVEIYELMELNNKYKVIYIAPCFCLQDILSGDIIALNTGDEYAVTKGFIEVS